MRSQDRNLLQEGENGNDYSHYLQIISSFQTKLSEKPAYTTFRRQQHGRIPKAKNQMRHWLIFSSSTNDSFILIRTIYSIVEL